MIAFLNFDGSSVGALPAGFTNTTTVPGHPGNYEVGTTGSISSPNGLYDAGGQTGGSALWTEFLAADEAIQFDQVVNLSGGLMNPLIRMSLNGQTGYGAFLSWSTPKIDFVVINAGGVITTLASPAIPLYSNGARVTVKLEIQGTNLRFKSWLSGTAEPTSWTASTTDSTYTAAGYGGFSNGGGSVDNVYFGPAETTFSGGFIPPVLSSGLMSSSSVQLNWTAASQSAGSMTYQLMRSPHGANTYLVVPGVISPAIDGAVAASTSYDYKVMASDGINASVSSNVLSLAIPGLPVATTFTVTGSPSGIVGAATTFTVRPNGHFTGSFTINPSGCGVSTPIVLAFASSSSPQTFTVTPLSAGTVTLASLNNGGLPNPPATTYLASTTATFYTLTGPSSGTQGVGSSEFTVAPNGPYTGTITVTPSGCGLSTPTVLTFASSSSPQTFAITPTSTGTVTLTATNSGGLPDANGLSYVSTSVSPSVAGSGQCLSLTFHDSDGNPTNLAALQSYTDLQTLAINGFPAGGSFTLEFNGQTTAPIPVTPTFLIPNAAYALWTIPVTPGTAYLVAVDTQASTSGYSAIAVAFIDGGETVLATTQFSEADGAYDYTVAGQALYGGDLYMKNLATVTPATSSLLILFSYNPGGTGSQSILDAISVTDVATSTTTFYGVQDPTCTHSNWSLLGPAGYFGDGYYLRTFALTTGIPVGAVAASAIQSALLALSSVEAGGLTVTDASGVGSGPYAITFGGPMGDVPQPPITTSDETATIVHTVVGGGYPTITINGGSPIEVPTWVLAPDSPFALGYLPQSAPDVSYYPVYQGISLLSGNWSNASSPGLSNRASVSSSEGDSGIFVTNVLPPATYQVAATWVTDGSLATNTPFTIQDSTGATLASVTVNQSVAPDDFTDQGYGWAIVATCTTTSPSTGLRVSFGNPGGQIGIDAIRIARTSDDLSVQIGPDDVVTLSIPDNWATTVAGVVPSFSGMTLTNNSGGSDLIPLVEDVKTMKVGYNIFPDFNYLPVMMYTDFAQRIQLPITDFVASDANGYPTTLSASQTPHLGICPLFQSPDEYGLDKGLDSAPSGYYTMIWDGASNMTFEQFGNYTQVEVLGYQNITGTTRNIRVYNLQAKESLTFSPQIYLKLYSTSGPDGSGNYACNVSNLHIYPPNPSDPTGLTPWGISETPPRWHPSFLAKLTNVGCLRFMDWLATADGTIAEFSDYRQPGMLATFSRNASAAVVSITNAGTPLFDPNHWVSLEITTATPHGITDGLVGLLGFTGTMEFSDASTATGAISGSFRYVSETVVQIGASRNDSDTSPRTMTNTVTGTTVGLTCSSPGVFVDIVDLCNQVNADLWLNISMAATDACVTSMAEYVAANLNSGLKVHVEYSNECWNFAFWTWFWCRNLTYQLTGSDTDSQPGHVHQSQHVHNLFIAAFTTAGRPGDVVRVIGTQGGDDAVTSDIVTAANTYSVAFEELASAPYMDNSSVNGIETIFQPVYDLMTVEQSIDFYEMMVEWGGLVGQQITLHQSILAAGGYPDVKMVCYEGGPDNMMPGNSTVDAFFRSHAIVRHPRMFGCWTRFFQKLQDAGCSLINIYYLTGAGYVSGSSLPSDTPYMWSNWIGWDQQPGTGNSTTDAINITSPEQVDQVKSEVGGAISYWNSLVPVTPPSGKPNKVTYRQLRTIGVSARGWKAI